MSDTIKLYTIGFTKKSAEQFFTKLKAARVVRVLDVRLNNISQLAGFSKKEDLEFFLRAINEMGYAHLPELAPTQDILTAYKKQKGDWKVYEPLFLKLIRERRIEATLDKGMFHGACLLCSEDKPQHCHRRLVAEYLAEKWGNIEIVHLT
jgi:uncharacterized protein (DUF488 family)